MSRKFQRVSAIYLTEFNTHFSVEYGPILPPDYNQQLRASRSYPGKIRCFCFHYSEFSDAYPQHNQQPVFFNNGILNGQRRGQHKTEQWSRDKHYAERIARPKPVEDKWGVYNE
jgi:hypothetical protein